ncbi:hypothetical protein A1507_16480 [Methylomonas koyamae]|uniref:Nucleotidyltransferase n=1 Tax=Methylomonas koyamae TaxID=702114 RepID=A0A177N9W3_9GAMM|nr:hypothetical protein [Methylomonas koyamae]OAI13880.1 hypothetical protein A1507_16480 [Methylomonas koyamae]
MAKAALELQKQHLAELIQAIQRCSYFLHASSEKLDWPLGADLLAAKKKDVGLFEILAAINERFAKLQDTLAAAMRHASLLAGEPNDNFLKVLSFYEKMGVIESLEVWQLCRATRNLAAHDYETDYFEIAEHFNSLYELSPTLYRTAGRFVAYCRDTLAIEANADDFSLDFSAIADI